ncbi:hypothetical protein [Bacillus thuringiensis]|uniref:hypothetical protein n=1 Tax=Bacillus thuringiensis TaxID=1428 RepID=UPI0020D27D3D|nr:hypothetical protein [Bacillus thuringiensis]
MTKIGEENFMGMKNIRITTIRKFDGNFPNRLDPTFKWRRKALVDGRNKVFFQKDGWLYVIRVKTQ